MVQTGSRERGTYRAPIQTRPMAYRAVRRVHRPARRRACRRGQVRDCFRLGARHIQHQHKQQRRQPDPNDRDARPRAGRQQSPHVHPFVSPSTRRTDHSLCRSGTKSAPAYRLCKPRPCASHGGSRVAPTKTPLSPTAVRPGCAGDLTAVDAPHAALRARPHGRSVGALWSPPPRRPSASARSPLRALCAAPSATPGS